ncbi:hypothetical protein L9F63_025587, partial [Diploptera punctata]
LPMCEDLFCTLCLSGYPTNKNHTLHKIVDCRSGRKVFDAFYEENGFRLKLYLLTQNCPAVVCYHIWTPFTLIAPFTEKMVFEVFEKKMVFEGFAEIIFAHPNGFRRLLPKKMVFDAFYEYPSS